MYSHSFQRIWIRFGMRPAYNLRMVIFAEKPRDARAAWTCSNASRRCSSYQRRPTVQQQTSDNDSSFQHFECTFCILGIFSKTGKSRVSHRVKMATRWPGRERWPKWPIDPVTYWPSSMCGVVMTLRCRCCRRTTQIDVLCCQQRCLHC